MGPLPSSLFALEEGQFLLFPALSLLPQDSVTITTASQTQMGVTGRSAGCVRRWRKGL